MKKILIMTAVAVAAAHGGYAQTATTDTGKKPAAPQRFQRVQTPEQKAAAEAQAKAQEADHQNMMDQLHITSLRPGKSGTAGQPNYANYDEAKANPFPNLPDPLTFNNGKKVTTAKEWWKRREEIKEGFDREVYGRVPKHVPDVTWKVAHDTIQMENGIAVREKRLIGHVDNSSYPQENVDIQLSLSTPADAKAGVPVVMVLS